jgi:putative SOS response-associated peptidase YedK
MCGRFSLDTLPKKLMQELDVTYPNFKPRTQIYPTNEVGIVFRTNGANELAQMTWGFERPFTKKPLINFRGYEAWEKRTWSKALHERRCIVPASGFFEWNENQPKGKRDRYRINPVHDDGLALGGVYEINTETGEMFFAIATTNPNKQMEKIHHRMPVILDHDEFTRWFESEDRDEIDHMMRAANEDWIELIKET